MIDCNKQDCETCPINGDRFDVSAETLRKLGLCFDAEEFKEDLAKRWG